MDGGDSSETLAVSGLANDGSDGHGVFPLRGRLKQVVTSLLLFKKISLKMAENQ